MVERLLSDSLTPSGVWTARSVSPFQSHFQDGLVDVLADLAGLPPTFIATGALDLALRRAFGQPR